MQKKAQICPYLDAGDVRCSGRFTMRQLAEAYRLCFGSPAECPVYDLLNAEHGCCREGAELAEAQAA